MAFYSFVIDDSLCYDKYDGVEYDAVGFNDVNYVGFDNEAVHLIASYAKVAARLSKAVAAK